MSEPTNKKGNTQEGVSRRDVMQGAAVAATTATMLGASSQAMAASAIPGTVLADDPNTRRVEARNIRAEAARINFRNTRDNTNLEQQPINDDEERFDDFRGNFTKALRHRADNGLVRPNSYQALLDALDSRETADFEAIPLGRQNDPNRVGLVSPRAAYAFEMTGRDAQASRIPPAPAWDGATTAAEMAELYWYSVTRDVPFTEYEDQNIIQRAADDLNSFSQSAIFPSVDGQVTPGTLFRGGIPIVGSSMGNLVGPYVSQFLMQPFTFGQLEVEQRYRKVVGGNANQRMTEYGEWLAVQRGFDPNAAAGGNATIFADGKRFLSRMRDLSEWVHRDFPLQAGLFALNILLNGANFDSSPFDPELPLPTTSEIGFVNFGAADLSQLVCYVSRQALTGAWFQKWACHRRLRPEAFGGRVNRQLTGAQDFGINEELLGSEALAKAIDNARAVNQDGSNANDGLLPMGFPEGSPTHPAYPGGHSSFIAATATVLKAFFNEDARFSAPVEANRTGTELQPVNAELTVLGELNKLVGNVTHARDGAGMHWRSDGVGNLIGEAMAIDTLRDYSVTKAEGFSLTLTKFNNEIIRIANGNVDVIGIRDAL